MRDVDKILVTRPSMPPLEEYVDEIKDIWDTRWLTNMGSKHDKFQQELIKYLQVENIELLTNGHMALELSLQALGLREGEVITTPFTFVSTTHAIVRNGLTPVFCDIDPVNFTIDCNKIEKLITERTCAIVPVHVYGNICDYKKIEKISLKYGLKVIYDAAHAFGEICNGKGVGTLGDISCFSFHATKVFNSIEGGAVCFSNKKFGRALYGLKNFGIRGPEEVDAVGANAKMNEFQAAMGICNLRHINKEIQKRENIVLHYKERLQGVPGLQLPVQQKDVKPNYAYFPVVINEHKFGSSRDDVYEKLKEENILTRKYFFPLTSKLACYNKMYDKYPTPIALDISQRVLTLPLYSDLGFEAVDEICDLILK